MSYCRRQEEPTIRGGTLHMKGMGMLVGNFELNL